MDIRQLKKITPGSHVKKIIQFQAGDRSNALRHALIVIGATVFASFFGGTGFVMVGFLGAIIAVLSYFITRRRLGMQVDDKRFSLIDSKLNSADYKWSDIKSFGFTQRGFGAGILEIEVESSAPIRLEVRTPEFDPSIRQILEVLEENVPAAVPRYFKLFRKGQHFQESLALGIVITAIGSSMMVGGIAIAVFQLLDQLARVGLCIFLIGVGFSIAGIGADILMRITRPLLKNSLSEPILFSRQPDRLSKIVYLGTTVLLIWVLLSLFLISAGLPFAGIWAMGIAIVATVALNLSAAAWRSFEEVVVTEGKIRIRRFTKVFEGYISDLEMEVHQAFNCRRLNLKTADWEVEIENHIVAGEELYSILDSIQKGEKLRPILSEEHPGFKFEYNDAD